MKILYGDHFGEFVCGYLGFLCCFRSLQNSNIPDGPFNVSMLRLYCSLYKEEEGGVMQAMEEHKKERRIIIG